MTGLLPDEEGKGVQRNCGTGCGEVGKAMWEGGGVRHVTVKLAIRNGRALEQMTTKQ